MRWRHVNVLRRCTVSKIEPGKSSRRGMQEGGTRVEHRQRERTGVMLARAQRLVHIFSHHASRGSVRERRGGAEGDMEADLFGT